MILADTSAWVEFDRATGSPTDVLLTGLIRSGDELAVTEPVLTEVLAGARDDRAHGDLRRLLLRCRLLRFDAVTDFEAAVLIYRRCRTAGFTPRGLIDCMIASVAGRTQSELLTLDGGLERVAAVLDIPLHGRAAE